MSQRINEPEIDKERGRNLITVLCPNYREETCQEYCGIKIRQEFKIRLSVFNPKLKSYQGMKAILLMQ